MFKKAFGLVALLAAFAFVGGNIASAQTADQLQSEINKLLAQIGQLQGGSTSCYSFTRDLTIGSTGADVTAWQNFVISKGHTIAAGATGYFGVQTQAATAAWQASVGVAPAAGYVGPITRAKHNSMCSSTTPTPTPGDDDDDDDDDDDNNFGGSDGEEASLEDFDAQAGDDSEVEEGQEDAEVLEFEFDVDGSDVQVQRVEVVASSTGNEEDPWDVFESATLWFDGDDVATVDDLDDEDTWDEESTDGEYSFRFNGVDTVVDDGETAEFVVSFTMQDNLDDLPESWDLWIPNNGVRALDEAGIDQYTGDDNDMVSVDLEEAGEDDELTIGEAADNPDAMTLPVEADEKSDMLTLAIMDLEADSATEIKDFIFDVLINEDGADTEDFDDVVSDLVLVIDGEEYDDWSVSGGDTATATVTFDLDGEDIVIDDGESVDVEVQAEFFATTTGAYDEGTTVSVRVQTADFEAVDAEGVDSGEDLEADQLEGSFTGDAHTLRTDGISISADPDDHEAEMEPAQFSGDEDKGIYTIVFEVSAFGEDLYVPFGAASSTAQSDEGVSFDILDSDNDVVTGNGTTTSDLSSSADEEDGAYVVREGSTETFTLTVNFNPSVDGSYKAVLQQVFFRDEDTADSAAVGQEAAPEGNFRTVGVDIDA